MVDPRVEQLEKKIDDLSGIVVNLRVDVAVLAGAMERIERDIATAQVERSKIASELGAYGIQLTKFVASHDNIEKALAALRPAVAELSEYQTEREGAAKAATLAGKIVMTGWAVLSAIVGAIVTGVAWIMSHSGNPSPPSH